MLENPLPTLRDISTHAPARGATCTPMSLFLSANKFQPTPLHEERRSAFVVRYTWARISTHAPARGATCMAARIILASSPISTHAPARGATLQPIACIPKSAISTHAPARGATLAPPISWATHSISTHAPARGATYAAMAWVEGLGRFQPTPLHEERLFSFRLAPTDIFISTHAPARGATRGMGSRCLRAIDFNPRPCTRSDQSTQSS